jgi:hypothetical protein
MTRLYDAIWDIQTAMACRYGWDGERRHELYPGGDITIRCAGDAGVYIRAWIRLRTRRGGHTYRRLILLPRKDYR